MTFRAGALRGVIALTLVTVVSACASVGGRSFPSAAGEYEGSISFQGQSVPGTLEIEQAGSKLNAVFRAPSFGLRAEGQGSIDSDGNVEMRLQYDLQCPGVATLTGELDKDGQGISGRLDAGDCTGEIAGTFSFTRQG